MIMSPRRQIQEDPIHADRWLISYADFITLLMAFFVVMYSISQVNEGKYRVFATTLTEAFNIPEYDIDPIRVGEIAKSNPLSVIDITKGADVDRLADGKGGEQYGETLNTNLPDMTGRLENVFENQINQNQIEILGDESWLQIELKSSLLFKPGKAELSYEAEALVNDIAGVLFDYDNPVRVEGFTDNQPINSAKFASNWELSAARAAAIVRQLVDSGIEPQRLAAVGYGEFQPKSDNDSEKGRAENRRVVFMVSRSEALRPEVLGLEPSASTSQEREKNEPEIVDYVKQDKQKQARREQLQKASEARQALAAEALSSSPPEIKPKTTKAPAENGGQNIDGLKTVPLSGGGLLFTSPDKNQ